MAKIMAKEENVAIKHVQRNENNGSMAAKIMPAGEMATK
jgi:hypothetical protein